jgi:transposase InsO family protein
LGVKSNWSRLAIDITHYKNKSYLSLVDCGPGRLAIWKKINNESATEICEKLREIFCERGPPAELLLDNGTVFRSETMKLLCEKWKVNIRFRAAFRASGNAIVERNHRTIKGIAERSRIDPIEAVFWYNLSPKNRGSCAPNQEIFRYDWRHPVMRDEELEEEEIRNRFKIGESVWVKPYPSRCTNQWNKGTVTKIISSNCVEVNGMARHVLDLRAIVKE